MWLQNKTYLPSTEIRNILVRSNSEAPVIDFPKKLLENPMNILRLEERDHWLL